VNASTDAAAGGNKYVLGSGGGGNPMIKRKLPQSGKLMRGNPPNSAIPTSNVPQGGNNNNNNNANNNNNINVAGKSGGYQSSMGMGQNQYSSYQGNSQIIHG